ncbi:hypothetical protein ACFX11_031560 [Malus domestica]
MLLQPYQDDFKSSEAGASVCRCRCWIRFLSSLHVVPFVVDGEGVSQISPLSFSIFFACCPLAAIFFTFSTPSRIEYSSAPIISKGFSWRGSQRRLGTRTNRSSSTQKAGTASTPWHPEDLKDCRFIIDESSAFHKDLILTHEAERSNGNTIIRSLLRTYKRGRGRTAA